jgi:tetratricopeptide (TPR) repeat protein
LIILKKRNYKRILKALIFAVAILGISVSCNSEEVSSSLERLFYRGNDAYEKGEYAEAIEEYKKVTGAGYGSGPLYYNLGNAYFKTGALGEAILNYERAKRLMPRDADLKANFRFVSSKIKGKVLERKGAWNWRPVRLYSGNMTINELLLLTSGIYVLLVLLLAFFVCRPDAGRRLLAVILLVFLVGICNAFITWHNISGIGKDAIVIAPVAESRYGPFDSATEFFKLYEGGSIKVLKKKADWCKIERADGKVGWVKKGEVEII